MTEPAPKLWTKAFLSVSLINFLITLVFYLLMVTIALYAVDVYGATTSQAGLITGIFIIGALTGRLFTGRYIDLAGRKRTLMAGLVFFALVMLLYYIDAGISMLLLTRFIHGLAIGIASTATATIAAQVIPPSRKGEGIGYFSMSTVLSTAIGPFIGLLLTQYTAFSVLFLFCLLVSGAAIVLGFSLRVEEAGRSAGKDEKRGFRLSQFVEPKALPIAVITLTSAFCYSGVLSFINFYAIDLDLLGAAGYFFLVYAVSVLFTRPFAGRLLDRKGANLVMFPAFLLFAGGLLLLSTAQSGTVLLLSAMLIGLGFGNIQSTTQAIAVKLTPPHRFGLATSTFFIALDIGLGFGPYLLGFLIAQTGYQTMYALLGVTAGAAAALYFFLHGKRERKKQAALKVSEAG